MTIDTTEATPDAEHAALMGASAGAIGIARAAVRIAADDMRKADQQLRNGDCDEAKIIIRECRAQMEYAERMLTGGIWASLSAGAPTP